MLVMTVQYGLRRPSLHSGHAGDKIARIRTHDRAAPIHLEVDGVASRHNTDVAE